MLRLMRKADPKIKWSGFRVVVYYKSKERAKESI